MFRGLCLALEIESVYWVLAGRIWNGLLGTKRVPFSRSAPNSFLFSPRYQHLLLGSEVNGTRLDTFLQQYCIMTFSTLRAILKIIGGVPQMVIFSERVPLAPFHLPNANIFVLDSDRNRFPNLTVDSFYQHVLETFRYDLYRSILLQQQLLYLLVVYFAKIQLFQ